MTTEPRSPGTALSALFALLTLAATSSGAARADSSCSFVRMDRQGGSMEHVTARSQEKLGICFAETAAQMLDAIRFSRLHERNYGFQTSAVALASGLSVEKGINAFREGGQACWAMDYARTHGVCSLKWVEAAPRRSDDYRHAAGELNELVQLGVGYRSYYSLFHDGRDGRDGHANRDDPGGQPVSGYGCSSSDRSGDPDALPPELMDTLIGKSCDLPRANRYLTRNCRYVNPFPKRVMSCDPFPENSAQRPATPSEYRTRVDSLLDRKDPLPIELHYCANFLDARSASGAPGAGAAQDGCGAHASLVIGRREFHGRCQYLVRNSWGTECWHYPKKLRPFCERGKGNIWLDAEELMSKTLRVVPPPDL